jgi:phage tail sheath gpL-like
LAANPRVDATLDIAFGGSENSGDQLTLTITCASLFSIPVAIEYTVAGGDTAETVPEQFAKLINTNATLQNAGIVADYRETTADHLTLRFPGPIGNGALVVATKSGGATETVTVANSGVPSGGSGPVIPTKDFVFPYNGSLLEFRYGTPVILSADQVSKLVKAGSPIY